MKKSFFSSIFIIFLSLTLVIVTPLYSSAETWFDNYTCWGFVNGFNSSSSVSASQSFITKSYSYNSGTSWFQLDYTSSTSVHTQLPSPFYNLKDMLYSPCYRRDSSSVGDDGYSNLSFSFNGDLQTIVTDLHISNDDFLCFCQLFQVRNELLDIHYSFGNIVTGNAFQPFASIDERFLVRNNGVPNMTTSSIIDSQLWSSPSAGTCYVLAYFNILGEDFLNYPDLSSLNSIVISLDFPTSSTPSLLTSFAPLLYKVSANGELQTLEYLNSIDNNVQIISDVLQQGSYTPPSSYSDLSNAISHGGGNLDNKIVGALNDDDIWSALSFTYVLSGATWVGTFLAQYYNGIPFLQGIYALILFFMICALLKNGALFKINRGDSGGSKHRKTR